MGQDNRLVGVLGHKGFYNLTIATVHKCKPVIKNSISTAKPL